MKTIKPISTISYNSFGFLRGTLERLEENGFIEFWAFIKHKKEDDEEKDHFHVYVEPAKQVDTTALRKAFTEVVTGSLLPLGCMPFKPSKFVDWYWYGIHDPAYLISHGGQTRKYRYQKENVVNSHQDYFDEMVRTNPMPVSEILKVKELIRLGYSAVEIAAIINTPVRYIAQTVYGIMELQKATLRLGDPHNGCFDETGEWIPQKKEGEE